jgi:enoyl-CoA hydratase/carnithine racemase
MCWTGRRKTKFGNKSKNMLYTFEEAMEFKSKIFAHLLWDEKDHVLTLTLNRPEKKNALNDILFRELAYALYYAHYNKDTWAVVIAANGDVFCAGADLKAGETKPGESVSTVLATKQEIALGDVFMNLHKPSIAKVHAPVYAGGFLIVCGCTHVIASANATFSLPEVKRGVWPFQVMYSMLQIMPMRQVIDFCMRAKTVDAVEAEKIGLVSKVVEAENLDKEVQDLVNEIFQYSPSGIRMGLEALDTIRNLPDNEIHAYLRQMFGESLQTEDAIEGKKAFAEKRKPVWKG